MVQKMHVMKVVRSDLHVLAKMNGDEEYRHVSRKGEVCYDSTFYASSKSRPGSGHKSQAPAKPNDYLDGPVGPPPNS